MTARTFYGDGNDIAGIHDPEGSGTLITGGTIVDAKGRPVTAGRTGDDIKGGVERTIEAGDIVVTPPGVPHFMRDVKDHIVFIKLIFEREK